MIACNHDLHGQCRTSSTGFARLRWLVALIVFALQPARGEAQPLPLNQTGRWQGPYELAAPFPANSYSGAHLAVLKGPADQTRVLMYGQSGAVGVWSFVPQTGLTIPKSQDNNPQPPPAEVNFFGVPHPGYDLFCSGAATLNGRLVVVGGQYRPDVGTETTFEFDPLYTIPSGNPWRRLENTLHGRWYATVTSLSDGKLLATSGTKSGYNFIFGGDTGTLQADLRPMAMANTVDWAIPIATGIAPSARKDHTAVLAKHASDYKTRMLIFGGETNPGQKANDVRAQYLDGQGDSTSKWIPFAAADDPVVGAGPSPRSRHTAIFYVPGLGGNPIMIVYGGSDASGNPLGDVWMLSLNEPTETSDSGTWTRLLAGSGSSPGERFGHSAVFDPGTGGNAPRMLIFGGRNSSFDLAGESVWALNLPKKNPPDPQDPYVPQWTQLTTSGGPPGAREGHAAVWDSYKDPGGSKFRMVVFGGKDDNGLRADTWSLWRTSGPEDEWTWSQAPVGASPTARWRAAANRDWHWDRMVLFGGEGATGLEDDLWALDLGNNEGTTLTWSELSERDPPTHPRPAARAGHTVVPHPLAVVERYPELFYPDDDSPPQYPGEWETRASAHRFLDPYPFMFVLPSGNVFHAGHRQSTQVLSTSSWTWGSTITATYENAGTAVMYRPGSILRCGLLGHDGPVGVSNTDTIRFSGANDSNNGWTAVGGQTLFQRKYHNVTMLPTGDVLVTGGLSDDDSTTAEKRPQIWTRSTGTWSPSLAKDFAIRNYHSAALLLSDGRIISSGGELFENLQANPDRDRVTIFEPPYLFDASGGYAQRPIITSAPCRISYGQEFFISIPDTAGLVGGTVCLVRPGAVTHSFNQDQRYVPLDMSVCTSGGRLRVVVPADSAIAPRGDYLLFIVKREDPDNNDNRVPSIGRWVRVGSTLPVACDGSAPAQTIDFTADVVWDTGAMLYWTAPGDDGSSGTAAEYHLRHSGQSPTEATFCSGTKVQTSSPQPGGSWEFVTVEDLTPCTQYYLAFKTRDESENWAGLSNVGQFTTTHSGMCGGMRAREAPASLALAEAVRQEAGLLGRVPSGGTALAAEMRLSNGSPVWSLYHLSAEEAVRLAGNDSSTVIVQEPDGSAGWYTRSRLRPGGSSFSLRSGRRERRFLFLGDFGLALASRAVGAGAAGLGQDVEVVQARHSRLGDVMATVDAGSSNDLGLLPGDTLTFRYEPAAQGAQDAKGEFLRITAGGVLAQAAGRRLPGGPAPPPALPGEFALHANQPNPFSRLTTLGFALPREEHVRLEVFDVLGRRVRTLADGSFDAGLHALTWDGRDASGVLLSAGVYVTRIHAGGFSAQRTMVLLP